MIELFGENHATTCKQPGPSSHRGLTLIAVLHQIVRPTPIVTPIQIANFGE